ncbi:DUF3644 domain-containing protein [Pseudovibrio exalbescens]|uniref:DUF3644 domain-containing protein n=1 Tax=Pseudovibrio exalbescens TaxID=197461 RepID=UPI001F3E9656|nr:DUF3644 domain-containing protein [Pseudovibrio exalbescens]
MSKRRRGNNLEKWEVSVVKAMIATGRYNDQEILSYFTRPNRPVNHRVILEIRTDQKHKNINACSDGELSNFLASWPDLDPETGLNAKGDELLIKAREAMIAAVHVFNGAGLTFRSELFITTAVIAWTYLMHAWFKREGVVYQYDDKRYWELSRCLRHDRCPVSASAKKNLEFLLEIRHEIEHKTTSRIDDTIGAYLQSCCINFNDLLKEEFGAQYSLERRLPIALQFVSFGSDQRRLLKKAQDLPPSLMSKISHFEEQLTEEQISDPAYKMRIYFVPVTSNRENSADSAVEFIKAPPRDAQELNRILLKEVSKTRHTATTVVAKAKEAGFVNFTMHSHTQLWKSLGARDPDKGYGCFGDYKGAWVWYDRWIERVLEHCRENHEKYT